MANQKRSWNYRAEDSTYDLSIADIGIILPGVYRGFDGKLAGNMNFGLTHLDTGYVVTNLAGDAISDKRGAIVSKQGVVVTEDGAETLAIGLGDVEFDRIDLIFMEHKYIQVAGGQAATYSVLPGIPSASPAVPTVPNSILQVVIGQLYIPANTTALNQVGVVWTRNDKPVISGLDSNVALKDEFNIFTENNRFDKAVGFSFGGTIDIGLTDAPDLNPALDLLITDDANLYKITDLTPEGELHFIRSRDLGTAIPIRLEIGTDFTIKHNQAVTAQEGSLGYKKIFNQGTSDVNVFVGDYVELIEYEGIWYVTNVWRKDGALDSTQANTFPIIGLDNLCFAFANNQLGTILQGIINSVCNMSSTNQYAFRAEKTANQTLSINDPVGSKTEGYNFEDDINDPNFDNGNDMYTNFYVTPADGIKQKFILENVIMNKISGSAVAVTYSMGIFVSTDGGATYTVLPGSKNNVTVISGADGTEVLNIPSIFTDYVTLLEGDIVAVKLNKVGGSLLGSLDFELEAGAIFSNSF